jgi:AraC-like DNA-binding protein
LARLCANVLLLSAKALFTQASLERAALPVDPAKEAGGNFMGRSNTKSLGALPNANGTLTRLAYEHVKASGIDPRPLLKQSNLRLDQIKNSSVRLRVRDQIRLLNLAATALQDDLLGFHLGQPPDLREFGFLYYVSASSERLGDALRQLARYASIANEGVSMRYLGGTNIGISFHYVGVSRHLDRHQIEFFVVALIRLCRQLTGTRLVPSRVKLTHRRDSKCAEFTKFLGGNAEFGAAIDVLEFASAVKDMPIVSADHHLNRLLISYCEDALRRRPNKRGSFRPSVENAIVPLLPHGRAKIDEVARRLGVSQRTLARRLSAERLTFSAILESLKIDLAERYLSDENLSISQIAWLLGYQEVSSLTHAFKRWTGQTPRQVRAPRAS